MAHDSQIVKAKENLKLSRGGLSYSLASGTNPPVKALRLIQFKNFFKRSFVAILVELEAKDLVDLVEPSSMVRAANALTISSEPSLTIFTQVNRMSRSRRVLAIGGKQRILRLDMVCIETIVFHLDSLWGIRTTYRSIVYRMMITLKTIHLFELNLFEFKSHLNSEMQ